MSTTIPENYRDLLLAEVATLSTIGPDGRPQMSEVWFLAEGDTVSISLNSSRQKMKNLLANPRVTLFVIDPDNPFRTLEVRATAEVTEDPGLEFLSRLLALYGTDLESFQAPKDDRVVVTLHASRIVELG